MANMTDMTELNITDITSMDWLNSLECLYEHCEDCPHWDANTCECDGDL